MGEKERRMEEGVEVARSVTLLLPLPAAMAAAHSMRRMMARRP